MIKRNHTYNVGDTEYSMEGYKLVCKTAGTTAPTPINMGGGQIITDGTVEWEVTLGEDAMPSDVYISYTFTPSVSTWKKTEEVAPANGYFMVFASAVRDTNGILRIVSSSGLEQASYGIYDLMVFMPVKKNDMLAVYGSHLIDENAKFDFYYSVGEAKRLGLI